MVPGIYDGRDFANGEGNALHHLHRWPDRRDHGRYQFRWSALRRGKRAAPFSGI